MKFRPLTLFAALCLPLAALAQSVTPQNTVIESDGPCEMVRTNTEMTITFRDKVRVTGTNMKLTCDYREVVVVVTGDISATVGKAEIFRSLVATGNVHLTQGYREAACGRAVVLPGEEKVVLTENPVLVDKDQGVRSAGKTITLLRAQHQAIIDQPIITAPPIKDLGVDKTPAPAPAPKQP